jgi:hypothetical protein
VILAARRASSTRQDRPRGFAPRGTSLGLVGMCGLAVGVPFNVLQCAAPFTVGGFDRWLNAIPFLLPLPFVPMVLFIIFARTRRYWTVWAIFYLGSGLLVAYGLSLLFALTAVAGVLPVRDSGLLVMPLVGLIYNVLLLGTAAFLLLRLLRLRYWQPGCDAETWEAGDEVPPAWAMSPSRRDQR